MPRPALKKRLGQHHLVDGRLCRPLVAYLEPSGQRVLEIGPGGGVLTAELLAAGARVLTCELDLEWAFALRRRLHGHADRDRLSTVVLDALELDWRRLPAPTLVAGNLPFNVATPLIARLLEHPERVPRAALMVQREVAERLTAQAGEAAYGALSVLVAARAEARSLGTVKPGSFRPPPKVAAGFVGLELRPPPLPAAEMPAFTRLVHLAFGQRRKTLRNALAAGWGRQRAEAILAEATRADPRIGPRTRAEELPLESFLELHRAARGAL